MGQSMMVTGKKDTPPVMDHSIIMMAACIMGSGRSTSVLVMACIKISRAPNIKDSGRITCSGAKAWSHGLRVPSTVDTM